MPYNYEILNYIKSKNKEYIWNLEKEWINKLKNYKYKPQIRFSGITECFKLK